MSALGLVLVVVLWLILFLIGAVVIACLSALPTIAVGIVIAIIWWQGFLFIEGHTRKSVKA